MIISAIIPVYNAASYLEACVASLRTLASTQNLMIEVVMVDDGSTDGSSELCDQLGDKVIHQSNRGVSAARNEGLKVATGDWLWFVDADDYVETMEQSTAISACPVLDFSGSHFVLLSFVWDEDGVATTYVAKANEIPYNLWRCLFKRERVMDHNLFFTEGRKYAEDQEFILKYLLTLGPSSSLALPQIQYHYTMRPGSAMNRKGVKFRKLCDIIGVIGSLWLSAFSQWRFPSWIWFQTRRLFKTVIVTCYK